MSFVIVATGAIQRLMVPYARRIEDESPPDFPST
jgi:hypothetical protein